MPNTLATAVCPSMAAQAVARNRPIEVAVRMIGMEAPVAVAGTTPTRTRPSAREPTMKHGSPRADGWPASGPVAAGAGTSWVRVPGWLDSLELASTAVMTAPSQMHPATYAGL